MNEVKHTPGPWTNSGWSSVSYQIHGDGEIIAVINTSYKKTGYGDDEIKAAIKEQQANASLISAAPELLEALEIADAQLVCLTDPLYDEGKKKIRIAITKA